MARWVRRRVPAGRVLALASQERGALERTGVTRAEADARLWLVRRDGTRVAGAEAVNGVLREAGSAWPAVAAIYRVPPLRAAEDAFYGWFARHRSSFRRFGITPECDHPDAGCE